MGNGRIGKNQYSSNDFHKDIKSDISVSDFKAFDLKGWGFVVDGWYDNDDKANDDYDELTGLKSGVDKRIVADDVVCEGLEALDV